MGGLGDFSFATPWALSALLLLPLLWHLLRTTPPKPQTIRFPAVRLLQELVNERVLATRTPWWILVLRSLMASLLIFSIAGPTLNAGDFTSSEERPHIVLVDNDWATMDHWPSYHKELKRLLRIAVENEHPFYLIGANGPHIDAAPTLSRLRHTIDRLTPHPWPIARTELLEKLKELMVKLDEPPTITWLSNGLTDPDQDDFLTQLIQLGSVEYVTESRATATAVLTNVQRHPDGFQIRLNTIQTSPPAPLSLQVLGTKGAILQQEQYTPTHINRNANVLLRLPAELKSRAERIRLSGVSTPAGQYLLDEKWRDQSVGIIAQKGQEKSLLAPAYYVQKSLSPYTQVRTAPLNDLLERNSAVIFDVSYNVFSKRQRRQLEDWIKQGGVLVRFAGKRADKQNIPQYDPLLPVQLLPGERTFGGSLSWKKADSLAPFPRHSPFYNLPTPDNVTIKKQILARPEANLSKKVWAHLQDGTPLITARAMDKGWSILFHVEAVPGWSDLPLSGTFEQMMKRLLSLSNQTETTNQPEKLPPYRLFDHNGLLAIPDHQSQPITLKQVNNLPPTQSRPPGLYGHSDMLKAYNLGPFVSQYRPIQDIPVGVTVRGFQEIEARSLAPWFLLGALVLGLIDWGLTLRLRSASSAVGLSGLLIALLLASPPARATDWDKALAAANNMRLAYMQTGNAKLDNTVQRGLDGLRLILRRRTAVELAPAMAFDPEKDDPSLFPMIYWAIHDNVPPLSAEAVEKLNRFLQTGGFILFDTMGHERPTLLAEATRNLKIAPLNVISKDHVLTRSFYLMQRFPGRFDHNDLWVESDADTKNDRVSSVLIGRNAWAQAWARDDAMRYLYPIVPGGEAQREQALRFGVNLVMYILSGNYKGDQVHVPAILQRLGL